MSKERAQSAWKMAEESESVNERKSFNHVSHDCLLTFIDDDNTRICRMEITHNAYGKFLFITTEYSHKQERATVTFFGCGYHEELKRWLLDDWFFYVSNPPSRDDRGSIQRKEARERLEARRSEIWVLARRTGQWGSKESEDIAEENDSTPASRETRIQVSRGSKSKRVSLVETLPLGRPISIDADTHVKSGKDRSEEKTGVHRRSPGSPRGTWRKNLPVEQIVDGYVNERKSLAELATQYGVDKYTILRRLQGLGIARRRPGGSNKIPLPAEEIVKHYKMGESMSSIADRYGVSRNTIRNRILAAGQRPRPRGRRRTN